MDAKKSIATIRSQQGWNDFSMMLLMLQFILADERRAERFVGYLRAAQNHENGV